MAILIGTTARRNAWINWLDHCSGRTGAWSNPSFYGRTIGGVPTPAVGPFLALETVLKATGYVARSRWAYNFRGIGGAVCTCGSYGKCSLHGNGIAVDIDPVQNPYIRTSTFRWSDTDFTPEQIAAVKAIKNTKGEQIWDWGGWWRTIKDYMHFELQVDPGSCEVDWSTVKGYQEGDEYVMKRGDKGRAVAEVQHALKEKWFYDNGTFTPLAGKSQYTGKAFGPGEDGDFGGVCEANIKRFQTAQGLPATGVCDGITHSMIFGRFGPATTVTGVTMTQVNTAIKTHASNPDAHHA